MDKVTFARAEALAVASEVLEALEDGCHAIVIAGSIRRGKERVGDIELLYVPKIVFRPVEDDLFGDVEAPVSLVDERLDELLAAGVLAKRRNARGVQAWGRANKLAVHVASGIPVDLFATSAECWHNALVCRTGPAESNMRIAAEARRKGWTWKPCGSGFATPGGPRRVTSEREVFLSVGLPYCEPEAR